MRFHAATEEDIPFINSVLNHPACRGHVGPDIQAALEFRGTLPKAITLVFEGGVIFGQPLCEKSALVLGAFLPEYRGTYSVMAHRHAVREAFSCMSFTRLVATIHHDNRASARNAIGLGFWNIQELGERIVMDLDYLRWSQTDPLCARIGVTALLRHGLVPLSHDEAGALGALWLTIVGGREDKAVEQHNIWALVSNGDYATYDKKNRMVLYRGIEMSTHSKED